ncbi:MULTISPECIES: HutD family protein [Clostridium]|uniref:HutD family protein n=1 Tax=Clostridium TaxID=1485 RepID=UPI0008243F0A|nr:MULTISPECIES: HutD family protein [Clostridium]PJI08847.1 hypothetical protein CUB90_13700 [Clostridium sp. CT7]
MKYDVEVIKKDNYKVSKWSGGKTIELYIYPRQSEYANRNFMWRISAAEVEANESTFTNLTGFSRQLMLTSGETILEHEGKYKVTLKPFQKDSFMGDWITKSYGRASDFNLMTSAKCSGDIHSFCIDSCDKVNIELSSHKNDFSKVMEYFYILGGNVEIILEENKFKLDEKDLFCIGYKMDEGNNELTIINTGNNEIRLIRTVVFMN